MNKAEKTTNERLATVKTSRNSNRQSQRGHRRRQVQKEKAESASSGLIGWALRKLFR
jgi:hypothetical protein